MVGGINKMILSKDEAISLILNFSDKNNIFSITKLNKILARLNLHFIPIDVDFSLNQYGSYNAELSDLKSGEYYDINKVKYKGRMFNKYTITEKGRKLFIEKIQKKLKTIMTDEELSCFKERIFELSQKQAREISDDEHKKLLVDVEDKFKLKQRINEINVEFYDLYEILDSIPEKSLDDIKFKALIEYCYFLIKYIKNKMDKKLDDESTYDFDAYMFDYYFIYNIYTFILPFIKKEIDIPNKNPIKLNKYYQFIIESVQHQYPFSIYNKDLKDLMIV